MNSPNENAELSVAEGVLLGHALVARVAAELGIRAFFIKGPVSVLQGLRKPKTSGDVDVFVSPQDLESMVDALQEKGWRKRPGDPDSKTFPKHSVTVGHPEWPCCIDVHFRFPGMEAPETDCFEAMWVRTDKCTLAGQDIRVPVLALGVLIVALHALRTPHLLSSRADVEFVARVSTELSLSAEVFGLAAETGSLAAARPFLEILLPTLPGVVWPESSVEWRNRLSAKEPGSAVLIMIFQSRWKDKPRALWQAIFPAKETLLSRNLYADVSLRGRFRLQAARWIRFLHSIPKIVRDLRQIDA